MLKNLIAFNNLGSRRNILWVYKNLSVGKPKSYESFKKYCESISEDLLFSFRGIIELLSFLDLIKLQGIDIVLKQIDSLTDDMSEERFGHVLNHLLFEKLKKNHTLSEFIPVEKVHFDSVINRYTISVSSIPIRYFQIRNLLFNTKGFELNPNIPNAIIIEKSLEKYLQNRIVKINDKEMSLDVFLRIQEYKNLQGVKAEEFVVRFEKQRLCNHLQKHEIKRVSEIDISAGFDILSFRNHDSKNLDIFIEVKSYKNIPSFYWSRNEVEVSKIKGNNYFLYLVNIDLILDSNYVPEIYENPFTSIFSNKDWYKDSQSWLVSQRDEYLLDTNSDSQN